MLELSPYEKITRFTSGNYSVTGFWIVLERKMTSHLLQMIMPSAMFVIVSWISFLMPLDRGAFNNYNVGQTLPNYSPQMNNCGISFCCSFYLLLFFFEKN